jgi:hypothetical protein
VRSIARGRSALRLGLLVDGFAAPQQVHDFVAWAKCHPSIMLMQLIVADPKMAKKSSCQGGNSPNVRPRRRDGLLRAFSELPLRAVEHLEGVLLRRDKHHADYLKGFDLRLLVRT